MFHFLFWFMNLFGQIIPKEVVICVGYQKSEFRVYQKRIKMLDKQLFSLFSPKFLPYLMIFEELLLNTYLVKYYKNIWEEWMTNHPCMELLEPENPIIGYRAQYILIIGNKIKHNNLTPKCSSWTNVNKGRKSFFNLQLIPFVTSISDIRI